MKQRSTKERNAAAPGTQAVTRAIAVINAIAGSAGELGLAELCTVLGLHKTTVFRLLGALEREGFVSRDAERQTFRLGPALIRLGAQARRATGLHEAARPVLEMLAASVGEAATLEVLVGAEVLILDEVRGRFLIGSSPEVGTRWPAHATSTGKVLLAAASHGATEHAAPAIGRLAKRGPNTITSRARLERELADVWRLGHAIGREEIEAGFVAIGAPVRNADGQVVAAISVGGPIARIDAARAHALASVVRAAADRVSDRLGAPIPPAGAPVPPSGRPRRPRAASP